MNGIFEERSQVGTGTEKTGKTGKIVEQDFVDVRV